MKKSFRLSPAKIFLIINLTIIVAVFIIGFRPNAFKRPIATGELASYNGQNISFLGRVCEEADVDYKSRRLTVCANGRALVTTNLYPTYDYGDFIKISGQLKPPPEIDGFDYENYLARYDIYSVMYYPKIFLVSIETTNGIAAAPMITTSLTYPQELYRGLINFKQKLKAIIDANLPEPEAGLADALLLGYRRTVDREDLKIFSRVGLSHMIAISGSHITILSAMIINFFLALGFRRRRALLIVFGFLILYPLITGLAASAVRSAIMGGLAFLAIYHGRASSLINALIFSGAVMLLCNPQILRADIGFQLSFLALLGIIYLYPLGESLTRKFLDKIKISPRFKKILKAGLDTINLTLVSQIITLPVLLINFKQFSLIAPLANILVIWTFPPLLASLIIGLFLTALIPTLGVIWFLPSYLLLKFIFIVSGLLAEPSWAALNLTWFNWRYGAGYYLILTILVILLNYRRRKIDKNRQ